MAVVPTATSPKFSRAGVTANWGEAVTVPVPVSDAGAGELDALLEKESDPEAAPLLFGAKATLIDRLWPAGIVKGKLAPLRAN